MDDAIRFIYRGALIYRTKYVKPQLELKDYSGTVDGIDIKKVIKLLFYAK